MKYVNGEKITRTIEARKGEKARGNPHYYLIDFDVTPHILRHTYITNLLLAGVDIKTVQYLAGHEQSKITLDIYAHLSLSASLPTTVPVKHGSFPALGRRGDFSYRPSGPGFASGPAAGLRLPPRRPR